MNRSALASLLALCLLAALPARASAPAPAIDTVLDQLYALHGVSGLALSPDATRLAWIETVRNIASPTDPTPHAAIRVTTLGTGASVRLSAGDGKAFFDEEEPVWSPDGAHVAFLSDARSPGQLQVYVADANGAGVRAISKLHGDVSALRWSPDGKRLALLYIPDAPGRAGPLAPAARDAGVVQSKIYEQRLALLDAVSGSLALLTPADVYAYEYDWAPDGHALAYTYAYGDGDNNWWIAQLATVDARSKKVTTIYKPRLQIARPRWLRDGHTIAFIEGLMSDEGSTGGDVFAVGATGGAPRALTPKFNGSASDLQPFGSEPALAVLYHRSGSVRVAKLATATSTFTPLTTETDGTYSDLTLSRDGATWAYVYQSFTQAPEVYVHTARGARRVTSLNTKAARYWGNARSVTWSNEGYTVQGWLLAPQRVDSGKKYPMVVIVHGGPASENLAVYPARQTAALASQGYFVFLPNPRGSFGQGERFTEANVKDFGYGDLRDIESGVSAAVKAAPIDPKAVGMYGWSYGGYMTMWMVTQTARFKAAVAGAGIMNWQSYYGENGIDQWMIPYFGASVYDDPGVYARSSPITYIKHTKTPTLVLQGERDTEVPAPQAYEFWHALKTLGVPTQLVIYPNEGHGVAKPADQKDIARRLVAWFDQYLKT